MLAVSILRAQNNVGEKSAKVPQKQQGLYSMVRTCIARICVLSVMSGSFNQYAPTKKQTNKGNTYN